MRRKFAWSTILSAVFVTTLLFFCSLSVLALDVPNPPKNGYVLDQTQTLTKEEIYTMNHMGLELQKKTKAQIAVLLIPTLDGEDVSDYANRVFRAWGIGDKEKNNGVLFLIALKDKQMRIEVGYGLEGAINDGKAGEILDQYAIPYFQKGKFGPGVMETYKVLVGEVSKEYGVSIDGSRIHAKQDSIELSPFQLLLIGVGILALIIVDMTFLGGAITQSILWILASGRGGGSGRSGGGGFGGFGGGSSGGGGASRRW
ncbi:MULTISPECIES: YgcG family protein [unclassified Veillonella]|uniref:TPM domain-containing protein n=1 Tax=unclassified Veillonella TaxID=2630086 RepID=UPI0013E0D2BE|nr:MULTISPECIES: TPM domain-containing protein [unclassified Veillonella]